MRTGMVAPLFYQRLFKSQQDSGLDKYIHVKQSDVIIHPCTNINGIVVTPQLKLRLGSIITSHMNLRMPQSQLTTVGVNLQKHSG